VRRGPRPFRTLVLARQEHACGRPGEKDHKPRSGGAGTPPRGL
jgi:hypothetical protein